MNQSEAAGTVPAVSNGLKMRDGDQPLPVRNEHEGIQTLVLRDLAVAEGTIYCGHHGYTLRLLAEDIRARREVGIQRYGTELQPHNGRDALRDAYEEALDLWVYLRQLVVECGTAAGTESMQETLDRALTDTIRTAGTLRTLLREAERFQVGGRR